MAKEPKPNNPPVEPAPIPVPEAVELLADPEDPDHVRAIKVAAEEGYNAFTHTDGAGSLKRYTLASDEGFPAFLGLTPLEKVLLYEKVAGMVANPGVGSYAAIMPDNNDRRTVRELDQCLRRALGHAEYRHEAGI